MLCLFHLLLVLADDTVMGLTVDGHLVRLSTKVIGEVRERVAPECHVDDDWELV